MTNFVYFSILGVSTIKLTQIESNIMKSEVTKEAEVYPMLKQGDNGLVILLTSSRVGTVLVRGESGNSVGKHRDSWVGLMAFDGAVKLSN